VIQGNWSGTNVASVLTSPSESVTRFLIEIGKVIQRVLNRTRVSRTEGRIDSVGLPGIESEPSYEDTVPEECDEESSVLYTDCLSHREDGSHPKGTTGPEGSELAECNEN